MANESPPSNEPLVQPAYLSNSDPSPGDPASDSTSGDGQISIQQLSELIPTVTSVPTWKPRKFSEQFRIVRTAGTSYLYGFDSTNNSWVNVGPTAPGYSKLADVTAPGAVNNLDTGAFTAKKFLRVMIYVPSISGAQQVNIQFNTDTGAHYDYGYLKDNGAPASATNDTSLYTDVSNATTSRFTVMDIYNFGTSAKFVRGLTARNAVESHQFSGRWTNTTDQITSVQLANTVNTFAAGTEIIVFGID